MPSILALVSKAIFKKQHPGAELGDVLPFDRYHSKNKRLTGLAEEGNLYLVTVRPDDVLWLVAVLRRPTFTGDGWVADTNTVPVQDITGRIPDFVFSSGKGLKPDPGKLGMSLQTPRELTEGDVGHLSGGRPPRTRKPASKKPAKKKSAAKKPAAKKPAPKKRTAKKPGAEAPPAGVPDDAEFDLVHGRWAAGRRDDDGLRHGVWKTYRADGSLYWEEGFALGKLHGDNRGYHPDGSVAVTSRFDDGREADTLVYAPNGETDIPGFDNDVPGLVRWQNLSDGRYGSTTTELLDAKSRRITVEGVLVPDRPDGVPETARYGAGDPKADVAARWNDGVVERGTQEALGLHRWWSEQGELTLRVLFDDQGRQRWRHETLEADPQQTCLEAFLAAEEHGFQTTYDLCKVWTPDLHERILARLEGAGDEAVEAYLDGLEHGGDWIDHYATPEGWVCFDTLALEVIDAWRERTRSPNGKAARQILWREIALRLETFDDKRIAAIWKRLGGPSEGEHHDDLIAEVEEMLSGALAERLDLAAEQRRTGETVSAADLLRLARRELRTPGLRILLGSPAKGEVLLLDGQERAYLCEEDRFTPAPVQVDTRRWTYARYIRAYDTLDERRLFWSGKNVWWAYYRFGTSLMLQGSAFFPDRDQGEVTLDAFVHCPTYAWTKRVLRMFGRTKPKAAREVDPYFHADKGWAFAWAYSTHANPRPHGRAFSRGLRDATIFSGGGSPGVTRLNMLDREAGAGPKPLDTYGSREEAIATLHEFELQALKLGYSLARVVNLPVAEPEVVAKPKTEKKAAPAAMGDVAEHAENELAKAAAATEAGSLTEALMHLRAAWDRRPAAAIADAMDRLSKSVEPTHGVAGRGKAPRAAWTALEAKRNPADLESLLGALTDAPSKEIVGRIENLLEWPEDPRLDRRLIEIAWDVPFTSSGSKPVWRRIFKRLSVSRDARILERLRGLPKRYETVWDTQAGQWGADEVTKIILARAATLDALGAIELTETELSLLGRCAVVSSADEEEAAVLDALLHPDDLDRRRKIAAIDGSVRGRIIALQDREEELDRAEKKELRGLLKANEKLLLGPLAGCVKKGATFKLGFASEVVVRSSASPDPSSPYWRTVERLEAWWQGELTASPQLVSLRELVGSTAVEENPSHEAWLAPIVGLANAKRLESLRLVAEPGQLLALFEAMPKQLPKLERIGLSSNHADISFDTAPPQLRGFVLHGSSGTAHLTQVDGEWRTVFSRVQADTLLQAFASGAGKLDTIGLEVSYSEFSKDTRFAFERAEDGYTLDVIVRGNLWAMFDGFMDNLQYLLSRLKDSACRRVQVAGKVPHRDKNAKLMEKAAKRSGLVLDLTAMKLLK